MPLFWIVHATDKGPFVFIQEATGSEIAILKASMAGFGGRPTEIHELDAKTAAKVPKKLIGKVLDQIEANALLKKIGT